MKQRSSWGVLDSWESGGSDCRRKQLERVCLENGNVLDITALCFIVCPRHEMKEL